MVKYSVIVPAYCAEPFVGQIRKMVENSQSLKDCLEIILVDDGSTDNTWQLFRCLAEKYEHVKILHQDNSGVSAARNAGLEAAAGAYIIFADADDVLNLAELIHYLQGADLPDLLILSFDNAADPACGQSHRAETIKLSVRNLREVFPERYKTFAGPVWNKVYSRSVMDTHHIRFVDEKKVGTEDVLFNLMYVIHCRKIAISDQKFYRYQVNRCSVSHQRYEPETLLKRFVHCADVLRDYYKSHGIKMDDFNVYFLYRQIRLCTKQFKQKNIQDDIIKAAKTIVCMDGMTEAVRNGSWRQYLKRVEHMSEDQIAAATEMMKDMI